jgi:hypothetical protein
MGTPQWSCYIVYRYPPVSSNQVFHPLHSCFCNNLYAATWSGIISDFRTSLRIFFDPAVNLFTRQILTNVNGKNFLRLLWHVDPLMGNARNTHAANNTEAVFSMKRALVKFTRARWRHTTKEEVRQVDVFRRSAPRPLLHSSQRANGLAE